VTLASVPGAALVVPLPAGEGAGGLSMHAGYAVSRRVAILLDVGIAGGLDESDFNHAVGAFVVRVWPASRIWLEAGPAVGDLGYGAEGSVVKGQSITGTGVAGRAGVSVLRRPTWSLDLEARYSRIGYDGFRADTLTFGIGASRLPRP
jgi:opacity protein-like surface antigen